MEDKKQEKILNKKDITKAYIRWWWTAEISNSFERMQAVAVCATMGPILQKLYKNKEDLVAALKRHLIFFNSQAIWGGLIHGTAIAMEEEKAMGQEIPDEVITGIKTGLMGPLAGIGDTLDWGTMQTLFTAITISFGATGSIVAPIFPCILGIWLFVEGLYLFRFGYSLGRESIRHILSGGIVKKLIDGASILGLFMMGSLSAMVVKLNTTIKFDVSGKDFIVQDVLDKIAPGLLPLGAIFLVYWMMKYKKMSITKVLCILVVLSIVGAVIKVF
ncbi:MULTISPECIES: PTS system mannose/fructose/sorbose family transporter subunit IID [Fusobacterium]|mgnify:FL=1|uniref:PTS system mannose/fructose/sorbose family transporter subunit IID n=1 Tax=Fusobacterium TaxID=848 RepID=UPI0012B26689|nr:PTS system mannose/fructose/sorbose family transporter subunit IID [Fusobacterium sp. FSA-380-WT-2B]MSS59984.1 PTS system mannose/fructose/sorbose family transporter subunit IID [Fusobacterium sp. FSA-380-WT-2B]